MALYKNDEMGSLEASAFMLVVYIALAGALWLCWSYVVDMLLLVFLNKYIATGETSLQTRNSAEWAVNFIRYGMPIILLFWFVTGINWAIIHSSGGVPNRSSFWLGVCVFFTFCLGGLIMSSAGGLMLDKIIEDTQDLPYQCHGTGDTGIGCQMQGDVNFFINYYYLICYMIPVLGAVLFFQSAMKRESMSAFTGTGW